MFDSSRDLDHQPQPDVAHVETTTHGQVLLSRCASCHGWIWRTPDRFGWSHSRPYRNAYNATGQEPVRGSFFQSPIDAVLDRHVTGESA